MKIKLNKLKCKKCGHEWIPRKEKVFVCPNPKCHTYKWEDKNKEEKDYDR